jgi:hypothetical protein
VVGITLALLSAVASFLFIPHHPVWAITAIAIDVFVIWALAAHGREFRYTTPSRPRRGTTTWPRP